MIVRERRFNLVVGAPRAGKTTFLSNLSKSYPENVIVVKHTSNINDPAFDWLPVKTMDNWRQGVSPSGFVKCKIAVSSKKAYRDFLKWALANFRNGLLIVDDATIFERDRLTEEMNEMVAMRAHNGMDIFNVYHGFTLLPIEQFIFVNYLIIFNTVDNLDYKKNKIPEYQKISSATDAARITYRTYPQTDKRRYQPQILKLT